MAGIGYAMRPVPTLSPPTKKVSPAPPDALPTPGQRVRARSRQHLVFGTLWFSLWLAGCAAHGANQPRHNEDFGLRNGRVWVRGPWEEIQPSKNVDEVIDQLCPAVMKLPLSHWADYGQEYCGLIYSLGQGLYYASAPSSLGKTEKQGTRIRKTCSLPLIVEDGRGRPSTIADYHSHPWAYSRMSAEDRWKSNQKWRIRIQFDTKCHIQKLIPNADNERPGELYERLGGQWKLIGLIKLEHKASGRITLVEETP